MVSKRPWLAAIWRWIRERPGLGAIVVIVAVIVAIRMVGAFGPVPVPAAIRREAPFHVLYPQQLQIENSSWRYESSQQIVTFTASGNNFGVTYTEQQLPLAYLNDAAAYDRFIGSLKPSANFNTPLGTASIASFVTSGNFDVEGATGVLNAKGVLLFVHPNQDLTSDQWQQLFVLGVSH